MHLPSATFPHTLARSPPPHLGHASRVETMHRYSAEENNEEAPGVAYTLTNAQVANTPSREGGNYGENRTMTELAKRNLIWDTLVELFGEPAPTRQALYGRVTQYLTDADATPDLIRQRATRIVTDWGPATLTLTSLEKHWSRFDGLAGQITDADVQAAKQKQRRNEIRQGLEDADDRK